METQAPYGGTRPTEQPYLLSRTPDRPEHFTLQTLQGEFTEFDSPELARKVDDLEQRVFSEMEGPKLFQELEERGRTNGE